jgi:hypothetical protein
MPTSTVTLTFVSTPTGETGSWSGVPSLASVLAGVGGGEALASGGASAEATLNLRLQTALPANATNIRTVFVAWYRAPGAYALVSMTLVANGVFRSLVNDPQVDSPDVPNPATFGTVGANVFNLSREAIAAGVSVEFIANDVADFNLEVYVDAVQAVIDYDLSAAPASPPASRVSLGAALGL